MKKLIALLSVSTLFTFGGFAQEVSVAHKAHEEKHVKGVKETADESLEILKEGNERFVNNMRLNTNFLEQVEITKGGQFPYAVVLGCMDSRVPAELVFDQGIGKIFNIRIAGNIVTDEVLGGLEYACELVGTKLIVVMGHAKCGAVSAAYNGDELGNLGSVLKHIEPSVKKVKGDKKNQSLSDSELIDLVIRDNVKDVRKEIGQKSSVIKKLIDKGEVKVVGAYYDVNTGQVVFFD